MKTAPPGRITAYVKHKPLRGLEIVAATESDTVTPTLRVNEPEPGLYLISVTVGQDAQEFTLPPLSIRFALPLVDIHGVWTVNADRESTAGLPLWRVEFLSQATAGAPVFSLFSHDDRSRVTCALADAAREAQVRLELMEEDACIHVRIDRFDRGQAETVTRYEDTLRLDLRDIPFAQALRDVGDWWESLPDMEPAPVPAAAREAVLSTWYSMHQQVTPEKIERECALSRDLGCSVVIVDDGWQTADSSRGYAYCGDWEIDEGKMPDMKGHVGRVQALGLRYVLWIAPLFMGRRMEHYTHFAGKYLYDSDHFRAAVLDPRFPDVREYIVTTFVRLMRELNLDGYKIDFVDLVGGTPREMYGRTGEGRDIASIPRAMDRLLVDLTAAFRQFKPEFLVEFRQSYVGPLMRKYGNMFRAGDCPNDFERNRFRTLAIRLLSGSTPAHADMFLWHPDDSAENAARQMLASLFAVPQISVWLDRIPASHRATLRHWVGFWREHRDILLDGRLEPLHPDLGFPVVAAENAKRRIVAVYDDVVAPLATPVPERLYLVNAGYRDRVVIECVEDEGARRFTSFDREGVRVREGEIVLTPGVHAVAVPVCGYTLLAGQI